ncbi:MAG TPA: ribosome-binding factor A [Candidatus Paceibacterota bacterium]|nr:ribosome-binding factor A [Candidatus Paceibacterota bacterium]
MSTHKEQFEEVIREMAAKFLAEESSVPNSLITVTKVDSSPDRKNVTVFFTVFPEDKQKSALEFAKRKRSIFKEFLKTDAALSRIPFVDFEIDYGERNRQNIDRISIEADETFEK